MHRQQQRTQRNAAPPPIGGAPTTAHKSLSIAGGASVRALEDHLNPAEFAVGLTRQEHDRIKKILSFEAESGQSAKNATTAKHYHDKNNKVGTATSGGGPTSSTGILTQVEAALLHVVRDPSDFLSQKEGEQKAKALIDQDKRERDERRKLRAQRAEERQKRREMNRAGGNGGDSSSMTETESSETDDDGDESAEDSPPEVFLSEFQQQQRAKDGSSRGDKKKLNKSTRRSGRKNKTKDGSALDLTTTSDMTSSLHSRSSHNVLSRSGMLNGAALTEADCDDIIELILFCNDLMKHDLLSLMELNSTPFEEESAVDRFAKRWEHVLANLAPSLFPQLLCGDDDDDNDDAGGKGGEKASGKGGNSRQKSLASPSSGTVGSSLVAHQLVDDEPARDDGGNNATATNVRPAVAFASNFSTKLAGKVRCTTASGRGRRASSFARALADAEAEANGQMTAKRAKELQAKFTLLEGMKATIRSSFQYAMEELALRHQEKNQHAFGHVAYNDAMFKAINANTRAKQTSFGLEAKNATLVSQLETAQKQIVSLTEENAKNVENYYRELMQVRQKMIELQRQQNDHSKVGELLEHPSRAAKGGADGRGGGGGSGKRRSEADSGETDGGGGPEGTERHLKYVNRKLTVECAVLNHTLVQRDHIIRALEREVEKFRSEIAKAKKLASEALLKDEAVDATLEEASKLVDVIGTLQGKCEMMEMEMAKKDELVAEAESKMFTAKAKLAMLETDMEELTKKHDSMSALFSSERKRLAMENETVKASVAEKTKVLEDELAAHKAQLSEMRRQHQADMEEMFHTQTETSQRVEKLSRDLVESEKVYVTDIAAKDVVIADRERLIVQLQRDLASQLASSAGGGGGGGAASGREGGDSSSHAAALAAGTASAASAGIVFVGEAATSGGGGDLFSSQRTSVASRPASAAFARDGSGRKTSAHSFASSPTASPIDEAVGGGEEGLKRKKQGQQFNKNRTASVHEASLAADEALRECLEEDKRAAEREETAGLVAKLTAAESENESLQTQTAMVDGKWRAKVSEVELEKKLLSDTVAVLTQQVASLEELIEKSQQNHDEGGEKDIQQKALTALRERIEAERAALAKAFEAQRLALEAANAEKLKQLMAEKRAQLKSNSDNRLQRMLLQSEGGGRAAASQYRSPFGAFLPLVDPSAGAGGNKSGVGSPLIVGGEVASPNQKSPFESKSQDAKKKRRPTSASSFSSDAFDNDDADQPSAQKDLVVTRSSPHASDLTRAQQDNLARLQKELREAMRAYGIIAHKQTMTTMTMTSMADADVVVGQASRTASKRRDKNNSEKFLLDGEDDDDEEENEEASKNKSVGEWALATGSVSQTQSGGFALYHAGLNTSTTTAPSPSGAAAGSGGGGAAFGRSQSISSTRSPSNRHSNSNNNNKRRDSTLSTFSATSTASKVGGGGGGGSYQSTRMKQLAALSGSMSPNGGGDAFLIAQLRAEVERLRKLTTEQQQQQMAMSSSAVSSPQHQGLRTMGPTSGSDKRRSTAQRSKSVVTLKDDVVASANHSNVSDSDSENEEHMGATDAIDRRLISTTSTASAVPFKAFASMSSLVGEENDDDRIGGPKSVNDQLLPSSSSSPSPSSLLHKNDNDKDDDGASFPLTQVATRAFGGSGVSVGRGNSNGGQAEDKEKEKEKSPPSSVSKAPLTTIATDPTLEGAATAPASLATKVTANKKDATVKAKPTTVTATSAAAGDGKGTTNPQQFTAQSLPTPNNDTGSVNMGIGGMVVRGAAPSLSTANNNANKHSLSATTKSSPPPHSAIAADATNSDNTYLISQHDGIVPNNNNDTTTKEVLQHHTFATVKPIPLQTQITRRVAVADGSSGGGIIIKGGRGGFDANRDASVGDDHHLQTTLANTEERLNATVVVGDISAVEALSPIKATDGGSNRPQSAPASHIPAAGKTNNNHNSSSGAASVSFSGTVPRYNLIPMSRPGSSAANRLSAALAHQQQQQQGGGGANSPPLMPSTLNYSTGGNRTMAKRSAAAFKRSAEILVNTTELFPGLESAAEHFDLFECVAKLKESLNQLIQVCADDVNARQRQLQQQQHDVSSAAAAAAGGDSDDDFVVDGDDTEQFVRDQMLLKFVIFRNLDSFGTALLNKLSKKKENILRRREDQLEGVLGALQNISLTRPKEAKLLKDQLAGKRTMMPTGTVSSLAVGAGGAGRVGGGRQVAMPLPVVQMELLPKLRPDSALSITNGNINDSSLHNSSRVNASSSQQNRSASRLGNGSGHPPPRPRSSAGNK